MARSALEVLPQDVTDILNEYSYFSDVLVVFYREGKIEEEIEKALRGVSTKGNKVGVCVVVNMPTFEGELEIPGPQFEASITIQAVEHPILNFGSLGTQKTAEQIAQKISEVLHHHFSTLYYSALRPPAGGGFVTPSREFKDHVAWNVRFVCQIQLNDLARVAMPEIAPEAEGAPDYERDGRSVTITCGTAGATIYYTIDETMPSPTNGTAYAGAFAVAAGTTVRARAYKAGLVASYIADAEFTYVGSTGYIDPETGESYVDPEGGQSYHEV